MVRSLAFHFELREGYFSISWRGLFPCFGDADTAGAFADLLAGEYFPVKVEDLLEVIGHFLVADDEAGVAVVKGARGG